MRQLLSLLTQSIITEPFLWASHCASADNSDTSLISDRMKPTKKAPCLPWTIPYL